MATAKAEVPSKRRWTVEEFDRWHSQQPERWELIQGVLVMMAQGSRRHTMIKTNIARHLGNKLAGSGCYVYVDGAEVKERNVDLSVVPDVVVECSPPDFSTPEAMEPTVLVEVLSPSSERDDTGRKWQGYCLIPSLCHYLVVDQERRFITVHTRTGPSSFAEDIVQEGPVELTRRRRVAVARRDLR
jgi:Uma2 family endonuclease